MGLTYKKSSRTLNFKEDKPTVQVLKPVRYPTITAEDLAEEIAQTQGVPKTMVLAVIPAVVVLMAVTPVAAAVSIKLKISIINNTQMEQTL